MGKEEINGLPVICAGSRIGLKVNNGLRFLGETELRQSA
jgi:hypothetical protein